MAIFETSSVVASISGKLNGVVFVNSKRAKVLRKTPTTTKGHSQDQVKIQADFLFINRQWQELTDNERLQWRRAAELVPTSNRLGVRRPLTGHQFFISENTRIYFQRIDIQEAPPALVRTQAIESPSLSNWAVADATWQTTIPLPSTNEDFLEIWVSTQMTDSDVRQPAIRRKIFAERRSTFPNENLRTDYEAEFGDPFAGQPLFVEFRQTQMTGLGAQTFLHGPIITSRGAIGA